MVKFLKDAIKTFILESWIISALVTIIVTYVSCTLR